MQPQIASLILGLFVGAAAVAADDLPLPRRFADPPDSAKPWTYWWWLKGCVSREGITRDLEEMKRQGIDGVLIFHAGGEAGPMPDGLRFLSPQWREMFRHALREAGRLGMEVSVNLCDGWDAGGPWIGPDQANKKLVYSEIQLDGPGKIGAVLPMPPVVDGYYREVAIVAFRGDPRRPPAPAEVSASSTPEGYCGERNRPPEDAADQDPDTAWISAAGGIRGRPAWLALRFADPIAAAAAYIVPPSNGNGPRECELEASPDGKTFETISRFTVEKDRPLRVEFPEVLAPWFRLLIRSAHGAPVGIAELAILRSGDEPALRRGIKWWRYKSGNRSFWDDPREGPAVLGEEYPEDGAFDCKAAEVLDLTGMMDARGSLEWKAPPGRWTVLRFGFTLLGQRTRCGVLSGYEADMLDSAWIERHFESVALPLLEDAAAAGGKVLRYLHVDSYELGADIRGQQPNWSAAFREEFRARRGYDLLPWLPALARRIVEGREATGRFLRDFRLTIGDLMAERFFGRFAELAHQQGVGMHSETGYGTYPYPHIDGLRCAGACDVTMGEFWHGTDIMSQFDPWGSVIRSVASAAHTYGRQIIQAEAFTAWSHWLESPAALKPAGDEAFCAGLNRMVFHQYTHQPRMDLKPGWQYGAGTHFDRNVTWWEEGRAFFCYLARCQLLLQDGRFAADAAYFNGEGVTSFVPGKRHLSPPLGPGYDFDALNADVLLRRTSVQDGRLVLPGGPSYRLLVLRPGAEMSPPVLRRLRDLVAEGLTVLGPRPRRAPGLTGYPGCDREIATLAEEMWGADAGSNTAEHRLGRGRVIEGKTPEEVLRGDGIGPDFEVISGRQSWAGVYGAAWIWHAGDGANPPPCERTFRAEFEVPADRKVLSALASMTADNGFELRLNGAVASRGENFHQVFDADVTALLRPGKNRIDVRASNAGTGPNPAGLIGKVLVELAGGPPLIVVTGESGWRSRAGDGPWAPARAVGPYGCPPWGAEDGPLDPSLEFIHRTSRDGEIYFVANRSRRAAFLECAFRVAGKEPEIWDPVTGEIRGAGAFSQAGGRTKIPLELGPWGSTFIVFRRPISLDRSGPATRNFPALKAISEIDGPWTVRFDPAWGGPESARFDHLVNWAARPEEGIRHYSGRATYVKVLDRPEGLVGRKDRVFLDLGEVKEVASVRWNGKEIGILWTAPFRAEITGLLEPAGNRLEIDVVNLWPNRLIGDAALPEEKRRTRTNVAYPKDAPLLESGLLGPVRILAED